MRTYYILVNGEEITVNIPELDELYEKIISGVRAQQPVNEYSELFDNEITQRYGQGARIVGTAV